MSNLKEYLDKVYNEAGPNIGEIEINNIKEALMKKGEKHGSVYFLDIHTFYEVFKKAKAPLLQRKIKADAAEAIKKAKKEADKKIAEAKKQGKPIFIGIPAEHYAEQTELLKFWEELGNSIYFSVFRDSSDKAGSRMHYSFKKEDVIKEAKKNKKIKFVIGEFVL